MSDTVTPAELSKELGITPRTIRQWLRDQGWQSVPYSRWHPTRNQADAVRAHFWL
jgi:uncharacterized protein YjcR